MVATIQSMSEFKKFVQTPRIQRKVGHAQQFVIGIAEALSDDALPVFSAFIASLPDHVTYIQLAMQNGNSESSC